MENTVMISSLLCNILIGCFCICLLYTSDAADE